MEMAWVVKSSFLLYSVCLLSFGMLGIEAVCCNNITERVFCILPESSSQHCPQGCSNCSTTTQMSHYVHEIFLSSTIVKFFSGYHVLGYGIKVTHVDQLKIMGLNDPKKGPSVINCTGLGGFVFGNSSNVVLENISIVNCGQQINFTKSTCKPYQCFAALAFDTVYNVSLRGISVNHSNGYGVYAERLYNDSVIINSVFSSNKGSADKHRGGNIVIFQLYCSETSSSHMKITNTHILDAYDNYSNPTATGLTVMLECNDFDVTISSCIFSGNTARSSEKNKLSTGGNLGIFFRNYRSVISNKVAVKDSLVLDGSAYFGAGVYISITYLPELAITRSDIPAQLKVSNVTIKHNHGWLLGGGMFIVTREIGKWKDVLGIMVFKDCMFIHNSLSSQSRGGSGLHIVSHNYPGYLQHGTLQYQFNFTDCTFSKNSFAESHEIHYRAGSGAVFIEQVQSSVIFTNCSFNKNKLSGIVLVQSNVILNGSINISGNSAINGGGILLCYQSFLYLMPNTSILLLDNYANKSGGAIFVDDQCLATYPMCFYQASLDVIHHERVIDSVQIEVINNTANSAGSAIYGGSIDHCQLQYVGSFKFSNKTLWEKVLKIYPNPNDSSLVSSSPQGVCFCNYSYTLGKMVPKCGIKDWNIIISPGQRFDRLHIVAVGQENGTVPGVINTHFYKEYKHSLIGCQYLTINKSRCVPYNQIVYSNKQNITVVLELDIVDLDSGSKISRFQFESPKIHVTLTKCPAGFTLTHHYKSHCDCVRILMNSNIICNITNSAIERSSLSRAWIGYQQNSGINKSHVLLCPYCPYGMCIEGYNISMIVSHKGIDENKQCAFGRSGVLCGTCKHSMLLGTLGCAPCSNYSLLLIVAFALAGIALVLLLTIFNITITEGTINGIVFYANMIHIDSAIYFKQPNSRCTSAFLDFLRIFIAWLNLDLGIKTCFYNGMDAYVKTWLQFVFPAYIWLLTAMIIFLSHKSITVSRIVGGNAIKVLATLFLLSYAKLLHTVVLATAPSSIHMYNSETDTLHTQLVWGYDGNVAFLHGKHIPLFTVAVGVGLVTLPYSLVLTFIQCLQKAPHYKLFFWVRRLKPLFDAYTGPLKDKCRYWIGLFLLLRVVKFIAFAFNVNNGYELPLTSNIVIVMIILTLTWSHSKIYKKKALNILESVSVVNLGLVSIFAMFYHTSTEKMITVTGLSVTTELLLFLAVICRHAYTQIVILKICCGHRHRTNYVEMTDSGKANQDSTQRPSRGAGQPPYREPLLGGSSQSQIQHSYM